MPPHRWGRGILRPVYRRGVEAELGRPNRDAPTPSHYQGEPEGTRYVGATEASPHLGEAEASQYLGKAEPSRYLGEAETSRSMKTFSLPKRSPTWTACTAPRSG